MPRHDRQISRLERWLFRHVPVTQRIARAGIYCGREAYALGFVKNPAIMRAAQAVALRHLHRQVADPDLRARLTPSYRMGCKRILLSNDYYPALTQPNVSLVTDGIKEIREKSVLTSDGTAHHVDTLIFGTGFHVTDFPLAHRIFGPDGVSLASRWSARPARTAFRGTTTAGFPNLFVLTGPNTGLGHTSQVFMIEAQIRYVLSALQSTPGGTGSTASRCAPRRRPPTTGWCSGRCAGPCGSPAAARAGTWTPTAATSALWPDFTWVYAWQTRRFDPSNYDLAGRSPHFRYWRSVSRNVSSAVNSGPSRVPLSPGWCP